MSEQYTQFAPAVAAGQQNEAVVAGELMVNEADEKTTCPASFIAVDPGGNPILVDQHV